MARSAAHLASVCLPLALTVGAAVAGGTEPSRSEYVTRLEIICKPRSLATTRAVRGTRADVQAERFGAAAARFAKARRIFAGTVRTIKQEPRPAADRAALSRWFTALDREIVYLDRSIAALRAEDLPQFQRASAQFFRQGSKSNNIVISFEFDYCAFKSSRYE
jgi:hypothetical protein